MIRFFSGDQIGEVQENISKSLADTFQLMFQMDIAPLPQSSATKDGTMIHSYMDLFYQGTCATLAIGLSPSAVEYIGNTLEPGINHHSPAIAQDIVCEINNIVANHLRAFLCDKMGVEFSLSLPRGGVPTYPSSGIHAINMGFRIRENEKLSLDFTYTPQQKIAV